MRKLDLGQTLQLLGNAGVIIGILLLVYELNQNRAIMMAQTRHDLSQGTVELLLELANGSGADIHTRGNRGEDLTELERARYTLMTIAQFRFHEDVVYQYRNGLFDEDEYQAQRESWKNTVFQNEGLVEVFCDRRDGLSPWFVAEIESLLTVHKCE